MEEENKKNINVSDKKEFYYIKRFLLVNRNPIKTKSEFHRKVEEFNQITINWGRFLKAFNQMYNSREIIKDEEGYTLRLGVFNPLFKKLIGDDGLGATKLSGKVLEIFDKTMTKKQDCNPINVLEIALELIPDIIEANEIIEDIKDKDVRDCLKKQKDNKKIKSLVDSIPLEELGLFL